MTFVINKKPQKVSFFKSETGQFPNNTLKNRSMCRSRDGFSSVQRLKVVETCVKTVEPFRALQVEAVFDADFP